MIDPKAAKLKMLQELQQYAKGALKERVMGGGASEAAPDEAEDNAPVPGVEEAEESPAVEVAEGVEAGGDMDPAMLEQLMALLAEQDKG